MEINERSFVDKWKSGKLGQDCAQVSWTVCNLAKLQGVIGKELPTFRIKIAIVENGKWYIIERERTRERECWEYSRE